MITGFNTDIEYQGVTYHVQTEDKGVKTPLILSLVYDRGTILASKRSSYDDLLIDNFDEKALSERLQKQHKIICAAVRAGRIEDLKRMTTREAASKQKAAVNVKEIGLLVGEKSPIKEISTVEPAEAGKIKIPGQPNYQEKTSSPNLSPIGKSAVESFKTFSEAKNELFGKSKDEVIWDVPISIVEETIIEAVQVVEELILPDEAVEVIADAVKNDSPFDNRLKIKLINEEKFKGGDRKILHILVNRGNVVKGLSGAQVSVKILGSSFRPLIFHAETDDNGMAKVYLQLPQFNSGRAVLLIKAMSEGEEVDLRRAVTHD